MINRNCAKIIIQIAIGIISLYLYRRQINWPRGDVAVIPPDESGPLHSIQEHRLHEYGDRRQAEAYPAQVDIIEYLLLGFNGY